MAHKNPLQHPFLVPSTEPGSRVKTTITEKIPKKLSPDSMKVILQAVRNGDRNNSRFMLSSTLHINDVVAEYCLRHLEEKLKVETDYESRVMQQVDGLPVSTPSDVDQFLRYAFGVQGLVSSAIARHLRSSGL